MLFNFMIGTQTSKPIRSYVHFATTLLFVLSPIYYYTFIMQLIASENAYILEHFVNFTISFLAPMILACGVKVVMFLIGEINQKQ